ncbi:MAG: putative ATP-dependent helicase DinG [candidate division BRC1 bacterium ADurb.BinA364]|nr:MAG: putative ATP-dependent helicase DinG [candidate division BRC1 bacterium ADurb.BinA364]
MPQPSDIQASPPIDSLIDREARLSIREAILSNDGGEVFFIGRLDRGGVCVEAEPYAFGNRHAVSAIHKAVRPGDVVIHNHPGGLLEPSDADLSVASKLGELAVGCYIVDNECERIRIVVKAFREETLVLLEPDEIASFFAAGGPLARSLQGYENRPQQVRMAREIARAFNENRIAVVEAGTGVGKSMAYLLPAILWAVKNRERVIVSTNTINLQEQLIAKDIPLLRERLGLEFSSEILKGRSNYLCLRRVEYARGERQTAESEDVREHLRGIFEWAPKTKTGDRSELPFAPAREAWEMTMSEADNCLRLKCPFYARCHFYNAKRRAARADLLVVNHHLLMADLAVRRETNNYTSAAVLPPFSRIVFDEAHNVEDVATQYFGLQASQLAFQRQLAKLSATGRARGILSFIARKAEDAAATMPKAVLDQVRHLYYFELEERRDDVEMESKQAFEEVANELLRMQGMLALPPRKEFKRRVAPDMMEGRFWRETVAGAVARVSASVGRLNKKAEEAIRIFEDFPQQSRDELVSPVLEFRAVCGKLAALAGRLNAFFQSGEDYCRWFELRSVRGNPAALTFCCAPLRVAADMRQSIYEPAKTVIMTSATLAVDRRFDFFLKQTGLDEFGANGAEQDSQFQEGGAARPAARVSTLLLATPFDFERQAFVGAPNDIPEPNQPEFPNTLEDMIRHSMYASEGRAFLLFTSYGLLDMMHRRLASEFSARGWLVLKQGQMSRHLLLEQFRAAPHPILFATSSFWEGVDVKGQTLQCLVLTRLPFQVPTEPILEARLEQIALEGRNPFMELTVPSAIIRFRQGFGRLIRARTDRGAVLICDPRVATRQYGRLFLRSLPTEAIHVGRCESVMERIRAFFASG